MNDEESAYSLLARGSELYDLGFHTQSAMVLERAREAAPGKGSILELLGRAYFGCGRYRRSAECFAEALNVDPTNDYAHYCLGLCCLKLGRRARAAGHFKLAWSLHPREDYRRMAQRFGAAGAASDG